MGGQYEGQKTGTCGTRRQGQCVVSGFWIQTCEAKIPSAESMHDLLEGSCQTQDEEAESFWGMGTPNANTLLHPVKNLPMLCTF